MHIVHPDSYLQKYRIFIDALPELHPFYTIQADFYDAPCWRYNLFSKPLTYWKGHAYAVQIDENKKVVEIYGGIEWGFTLTRFSFYPSCITPRKLTKEEQDFDFAFFTSKNC